MSSPSLEAFLARLYTDDQLLAAFLESPGETAQAAGLDAETIAALSGVDRDGLIMAARSFQAKRAGRSPPRRFARLRTLLRPRNCLRGRGPNL